MGALIDEGGVTGAGATAFKALRVAQWRHFAVLPAASIGREALADPARAWLTFSRGALTASLALAFSYGINAVHDRAMDRSDTKNPLAGLPRVPPATQALVWACGALALVVAAPGGPMAVTCAMASLLAGAVYSAGPRLKTVPFLGTTLNVGIFLPLMGVTGSLSFRGPALPIMFTALLLQNQLWHEHEDLDEDRGAGIHTTAALLGERGTAAAAFALGVAGAMVAAGVCAGQGRWQEAAASVIAGALGSLVPRLAAPGRRRAAHRAAAIAGGALIYAAGLAASG